VLHKIAGNLRQILVEQGFKCDCWCDVCDKKSLFLLTHYIEIPLVIQGKRNHNICDVRLDYGAEVLEDYRVE